MHACENSNCQQTSRALDFRFGARGPRKRESWSPIGSWLDHFCEFDTRSHEGSCRILFPLGRTHRVQKSHFFHHWHPSPFVYHPLLSLHAQANRVFSESGPLPQDIDGTKLKCPISWRQEKKVPNGPSAHVSHTRCQNMAPLLPPQSESYMVRWVFVVGHFGGRSRGRP